jgi:hypothetical protein
MRYGTLCIVDLKRRAFSAEMYALLVNFANLVVQELERDSTSMREVQGEANAVADGQQRIQALVAASTSEPAGRLAGPGWTGDRGGIAADLTGRC